MRAQTVRRFVLLCASLAPFACVTTSSNPQAQAFDAGPLPGFDGQAPFDGAVPGDAAIPDALLPDAAGVANVTVMGTDGLPKGGVMVVFQDAAGAVVATQTTGADGRASSAVADGSMITVAVGGPGARELVTFLGIKNGDDIVALDVMPRPSAFPSVAVTPPGGAPTAATSYYAYAGDCNTSSAPPVQPIAVFLDAPCLNAGKAPLVALALDGNQGVLAWTSATGVAVLATDGGTAIAPPLPAWSLAFGSVNVSVTNVPATAPSLALVNAELAGGVALHQSALPAPTEGAASASLRTLPGYADSFQPEAQIVRSNGGGPRYIQSVSFVAKNVPPVASGGTVSFDLAQAFPLIDDAIVDSTLPGQPKLTWTAAGALTGAQGGFARMTWTASQQDGSLESSGWSFVFPASTARLAAPVVPASLAAWTPGNETVQLDAVGFFAVDAVASYEALWSRYPGYIPRVGYRAGLEFVTPPLPSGVTMRGVFAHPNG